MCCFIKTTEMEIQVLYTATNCLLNAAALMHQAKRKTIKKKYAAQWLMKREAEGFSHKLLKEIQCEDTKLYRKILRITPAQFAFLLEEVRPYISKQDTKFRNCISPEERLQVTLRYLATGESQMSLQLPFRIQQSTISRILKESIPAIYLALNEKNLKFPANEQDWRNISKDFYQMCGFPNCVGAIDGKHCRILPLRKAGSTYFNYKGYHSFVLMAIADANYRFIYADVGVNGRVGDAGIWLNSDLKYAIENNEVHIPSSCALPLTSIHSPFVLLADDAFALKNYLMKPYSHLRLTPSELKYNYMLSRSRRVVENAFGILANRFRVLFSPIYRSPAAAVQIVLSCVCVHNFLRTENMKTRTSFDSISETEIDEIICKNYISTASERNLPKRSADEIRKNLEIYFSALN